MDDDKPAQNEYYHLDSRGRANWNVRVIGREVWMEFIVQGLMVRLQLDHQEMEDFADGFILLAKNLRDNIKLLDESTDSVVSCQLPGGK